MGRSVSRPTMTDMWKWCSVVLVLTIVQAQRRNYSGFPCPSKCVCFRNTIRCMQLQLEEVPKVPLHTALLDLRFNKIREIKPGVFISNRNIRSILLNDNLLTHLDDGAFTGLIQLRHLYLYKNKIKHIGGNVFQGLPRLEHLYLHNNELETFESGTFSNLPSLQRLFLYHNKIQRIPAGAFERLPRLNRLRLDQNALICDCELSWLAEKIQKESFHLAAHCKYPHDMYGKPLRGMKPKDFHCKAPEIMEGPEDLQIDLGGTAMFNCKILDDRSSSITWMKDEHKIGSSNPRYEVMKNGSLMIKSTKMDDGGHYECVAKNHDGTAKSRSARMIVVDSTITNTIGYGPPRFLATPTSVSSTDGAPEVRMLCSATGSPPLTISWSYNGIRLLPSPRHTFLQDGSLLIRPVQASDHGTYVCEAANSHGRLTAQANLLINVEPTFSVLPENIVTDLGKPVRLDCVAVGSPKPKITWYKNNAEVTSNQRIFISGDGTLLEIKTAKESDEGLYICEARNELGSREVSADVKINQAAHKPPKLIFKPYNMEAIAGSTIEMPCKAKGDPAPGIQWQKDGQGLFRNGRTKVAISGNLYIYGVAQEDQGRYECTALNEYGRDSAAGYITVIQDSRRDFGIGDTFVRVAFNEATQEVDRAINNTIGNLYNNKGPHDPAQLFRLFRYPDAPTRELAKAAEVYERTLVNIRRHVQEGDTMNHTSNYNYKEILSPEHLELVARLSGCLAHRHFRNCTDMCYHSRYRSIDGTCNNLQHPMWGASYTGFRRILKPIYEDGFSTPIGWNKEMRYYGHEKPPSRLVSTELISTDRITEDDEITHMVMQWGQFLDHDLDHATPSVSSESWDGIDCKKSCEYAAPCYPMDIPPGDKRGNNRRCIDFIRSAAICGSGMTSVFFEAIQPREQINQLTSYIDASQVYGFSEELAKNLRDLNNEGGRLREGVAFPERKPLLPYAENQGVDCRRNLSESTVNCFVAGDIRANEQAGLIAMHTLWMREHNRLARELKYLNPLWDGEVLYQEARKIIGAAMQHITYTQWLPYIIGEEGMALLGPYRGYDPSIEATISNEFATAALRFGHTLINPVLHRLDWKFQPIREGHLPLRHAFFSPWRIVDEGGIDPLLRGLFFVPAKLKRPRENLNAELTEQLFKTAHAVALDLAAMNIHRARDHGIPGYIEYRKFCNMTEVDTFDDLRNEISDPLIREKLRELYGHPGNIDIFVGGILEDQLDGARVGPLFRCLLIEQFQRLRNGDRFYYENPSVYKPEQLVQIKQYTLGRVLCDNGDNITRITKNAFLLPELQGGLIECDQIPRVNLRSWSECCNDCRFSGQLNTISRLNSRSKRQSERKDNVLAPWDITNTKPTCKCENRNLKRRVASLEKTLKDLEASLNEINEMINHINSRN